MTALPPAAEALTRASGRFEYASRRFLKPASGVGEDEDAATAHVETITARVQLQASIAVPRFSDDMYEALLELQSDR